MVAFDASSVPVVIKSATIEPSCVIAVLYCPSYPVLLNPKPPIFHRHTLVALARFLLFAMVISYGSPSALK